MTTHSTDTTEKQRFSVRFAPGEPRDFDSLKKAGRHALTQLDNHRKWCMKFNTAMLANIDDVEQDITRLVDAPNEFKGWFSIEKELDDYTGLKMRLTIQEVEQS